MQHPLNVDPERAGNACSVMYNKIQILKVVLDFAFLPLIYVVHFPVLRKQSHINKATWLNHEWCFEVASKIISADLSVRHDGLLCCL